MKRPIFQGLAPLILAALVCLAFGKPMFGQDSCPLSFPAYPSNELTASITVYPYFNSSLGMQEPLESVFLVDVSTNVSGSNPAIPYGLYPAWCVDAQTAVVPTPTQSTVPGDTVSGELYSTCDLDLNSELPPGHPNAYVAPAVWQMVNYILNNATYDGTNAFYWSVQAAIDTLVGSAAGASDNCSGNTPIQDGCGNYPTYDPVVVQGLLTAASNNAAAWVPVSGDVVGAVYVTATNSQFLLLEVPYVAPLPPGNYADVAVTMTGVPNPIGVSNQLTYTLTVTNIGPTNAPDVVLTDSLPATVIFSSVSVTQGNPTDVSHAVDWDIGPLKVHGSATATIIVVPTVAGVITNTAIVTLIPGTNSVTDPNLANNTASVTTLVTNEAIVFDTPVLNPQTGLWDQTVQFNNYSGGTASAVRIYLLDLASNVEVYNATGTTNGTPYVEYDQSIPNGSNVVFLIEYYDSNRLRPVATNFAAAFVPAVTVPAPTNQIAIIQLDRPRFISQNLFTIEFTSIPGSNYVVQYSSGVSGPWLTAVPPIMATNTRTQWVDSGPPETVSPPGSNTARFYQVLEIP